MTSTTITLADRLPADVLVFDSVKFQELEATRLANGLGPKDHESMRPLSEQSGAFHPYLGRWVDGDKSGMNGFKTYGSGGLQQVGECLSLLCDHLGVERLTRAQYYGHLDWMRQHIGGRTAQSGKNAGQPLTATTRSKYAGFFAALSLRDAVEFKIAQRDDPEQPMLVQWRAMRAWKREEDGAKFAADNEQRYAAMPSDKYFDEASNVRAALTWPAKRLNMTVESLTADPAVLTKLTSTELQVFVGMLAPLHMHAAEIGQGETVDIRWACRDAEVWATAVNGQLKAGLDELARRAKEAGSIFLFRTDEDLTRRIDNSTFSNRLHAARGRLAKAEGVDAMGTHALRRYANMQVLRDHGTRSAVMSAMLKVHAHGAAVAIGAPDRVAPYNRPEAPTKTAATPADDEPTPDPIAGPGPDGPLATPAVADDAPESEQQPLSHGHPPRRT